MHVFLLSRCTCDTFCSRERPARAEDRLCEQRANVRRVGCENNKARFFFFFFFKPKKRVVSCPFFTLGSFSIIVVVVGGGGIVLSLLGCASLATRVSLCLARSGQVPLALTNSRSSYRWWLRYRPRACIILYGTPPPAATAVPQQ